MAKFRTMRTVDTLFLQAVFCPVPALLDLQTSSLESLTAYDRQYPLAADFCFAGYVAPELRDSLAARIAAALPHRNVTFLPFANNAGKARVVNDALKWLESRGRRYRDILTFDSDIQFVAQEPDLLGRLKALGAGIEAVWNRPFGLIACNFTGDNAHQVSRFDRRARIGHETIAWPSNPGHPGGGIAGGCLFLSMEAWQATGGYRATGVYGPDDGYLLIDMATAGYAYCVAETLHVHHPHQTAIPEYNEWKRTAMREALQSDFNRDGAGIQALTESSDQFWRSLQGSPKAPETR
jgi:hypothetical protein